LLELTWGGRRLKAFLPLFLAKKRRREKMKEGHARCWRISEVFNPEGKSIGRVKQALLIIPTCFDAAKAEGYTMKRVQTWYTFYPINLFPAYQAAFEKWEGRRKGGEG
jgi:hypothetical protein